MVETNHLRGGILVEVAPNRIADLVSQTVEIIGFCHDGRTHSPGDVPPFRGFLYDKYELTHQILPRQDMTFAGRGPIVGCGDAFRLYREQEGPGLRPRALGGAGVT